MWADYWAILDRAMMMNLPPFHIICIHTTWTYLSTYAIGTDNLL